LAALSSASSTLPAPWLPLTVSCTAEEHEEHQHYQQVSVVVKWNLKDLARIMRHDRRGCMR
jgi:hypothetical protein